MKIAVDFDGTIQLKDGSCNFALVSFLRAHQGAGHSVGLYTSRTGKRLQEAITFCKANGLLLNWVVGGKPVADLYIDDKAMRP